MSLDSYALQGHIYQRLVEALNDAGENGASVPIYDHIRPDAPNIFCRIDGWSMVDRSPKNCTHTIHSFYVHVFHRPSGQKTHHIGMRECKRLQTKVVQALHRFEMNGAGIIRHEESTIDDDEDGLTRHGRSRFKIQTRS